MGSTTMGVKLDEATRDRIKGAAQRIDRTPHWLIKQAIFNYLERLENGSVLPELPTTHVTPIAEADDIMPQVTESAHQPFLDFAEQVLPLPPILCGHERGLERDMQAIFRYLYQPAPSGGGDR